jgi:YhcH/YjgK/YiaL family protein
MDQRDKETPLMAIYGPVAVCAEQVGDRPGFATAFTFLQEVLDGSHSAAREVAALAEGENKRIDLDGDRVYALLQHPRTKPRAEQQAEAHQAYADVQAVIDGDEILEVMPLDGLETTLPYDAQRDVSLYRMPDPAAASKLVMRRGLAAVLFPADGHAPLQAPDGTPRPSRRVVVKVQVK